MPDYREKRAGGPAEPPDAGLEDDPIIAELRRMHDGVVDEPLPDGLLELLRRLDEAERRR